MPEAWNVADATPIFKKGIPGDPGNYRLVTFTFAPGKVVENVIEKEPGFSLQSEDLPD